MSKPNDNKVDGYTWFNKVCHKLTPKINPILSKSYFDVKYGNNISGEKFYQLIDNTTTIKRKESPVIPSFCNTQFIKRQ